MAGSLAAAAALVTGAQYITKQPGLGSISATPDPLPEEDWEQTLAQIQLESGITAPAPPSQTTVNELLTAAQSPNLTSTIGRTLLVNLSAANSQGLGSDIPTQESIVEAAAAKVGANISSSYSFAGLIKVPQTPESLRAYGNQVMRVMLSYPKASMAETLLAFGEALDYNNRAKLANLEAAKGAYVALAAELSATPVPDTLSPLHLRVVQKIEEMGKAVGEMAIVLDDPLRGLGGLQVYQSSAGEASRLLTTIAETFNNNGILFTKDEPGSAWSAFVASP
jgi:hypothetical protein